MLLPRARQLHEEAHRQCFIARSVNFPITLAVPDEHQIPELPQFSTRLGAPIAVLKPRQSKKPSQVSGNDDARLAALRAEQEAERRRRDTSADPNASAHATRAAAMTAQRTNAPA